MSRTDEPWRDYAACLGHARRGDDPWFREDDEADFLGPRPPRWGEHAAQEIALQICGECPVDIECLIFALATESLPRTRPRSGIFGGLTARERARMSRRRG